jgi:hypothetical protein
MALGLALGMSLSVVQGSLMAAEMAVAADAPHRPSDFHGCSGGDHEGMNAGTCLAICGPAPQGLMPGELLTLPRASRTGFQIGRQHLSGQFHSPEPGPPKILFLG